MKNLYLCEKCGQTFEDYDKAYACEKSHAALIYPLEQCGGENLITDYKPGEAYPTTLPIVFWKYAPDTNEKEEVVVVYQLQGVNQELTEKLKQDREEEKRKHEKMIENKERMIQELEAARIEIPPEIIDRYWVLVKFYERNMEPKENETKGA